MAFRRAPQGPHFDPKSPTPPPNRTSSLGPGQNIRNSFPLRIPTAKQVLGNASVSNVNRSVSNFLRRLGSR